MNLSPSQTLGADAQKLVETLKTLEPGQEITWAKMNSLVPGLSLQNKHRHVLSSARRHLLAKHKIDLLSVVGVGLKRPTASESSKLGESFRKRIHRASRRLGKKVLCADFDKMTNEEKVVANTALSMSGALCLFTSIKQRNLILESCRKGQKSLEAREALSIPQISKNLFDNGR